MKFFEEPEVEVEKFYISDIITWSPDIDETERGD